MSGFAAVLDANASAPVSAASSSPFSFTRAQWFAP
jgi:hypothetical protein